MMDTNYQLIILGSANSFRRKIEDAFFKYLAELGVEAKNVIVFDAAGFGHYQSNAPAFCIYFGDPKGNFSDLALVQRLQSEGRVILPVVDDLTKFTPQVPEALRPVNGFQLSVDTDVESLVGVVLEGLSLLRLSRRLFISYKRDESTAVAIQLFENLVKAGFDVFLDSYSIRPAADFQDELWHRLADTDIVILLNTPKFMESQWTTQELSKANTMSIGILQLVWPSFTQASFSDLTVARQLTDTDFVNKYYSTSLGHLEEPMVKQIISQTESLRARSLAARQTNMIKEFLGAAAKTKVAATIQPGKFLMVTKKNGNNLIMIPTIGVPQAFTYYQSIELVKTIKTNRTDGVYLLYDHLNILDKWVKHLNWLDSYLEVKTLKVLELETKLPTLI